MISSSTESKYKVRNYYEGLDNKVEVIITAL